MSKLKFLGSGGAFSKIELNNSAYLTKKQALFLLQYSIKSAIYLLTGSRNSAIIISMKHRGVIK